MNDYLIQFDQYLKLNVEQFIELINQTNGIKLNELKVIDLSYFNDNLITPAHGVYIFKTKDRILLVGKARSNSFTERIPKHFDIRPNAWFNRLLFITCREHLKTDLNEENFKGASKYVFENARLILINIKNPNQIDKFENILRGTAETLNRYKRKKYDRNIILENI